MLIWSSLLRDYVTGVVWYTNNIENVSDTYAFWAINLTRRCIIKYSDKKQSSHAKSVHVSSALSNHTDHSIKYSYRTRSNCTISFCIVIIILIHLTELQHCGLLRAIKKISFTHTHTHTPMEDEREIIALLAKGERVTKRAASEPFGTVCHHVVTKHAATDVMFRLVHVFSINFMCWFW